MKIMADLNNIHKKMLNEVLGRQKGKGGTNTNIIVEKDKIVRQAVMDLYLLLVELNDPNAAIELLADHVAIMVDMINEFKQK